ncbi:MAG: tyrosine-type recombinase/integrase, partial [Terriglobales bacterium]
TALYRGTLGSPKTKGSRRTLPIPQTLREDLQRLFAITTHPEPDALVFQSVRGTPLSDTNLLHRHLKPAGSKLGIPWLNWHTLRRTHATLFQLAGGSLREAQAQLGHSRMSTTLEIYTLPLPASQRAAVEKLSEMMANDGEFVTVRGPQSPLVQ